MLLEKEMTLLEMFNTHQGLPVWKFPHHLEIYEDFFMRYRGKNSGVLEIGVKDGGSLELWRKYFGFEARVYGLDIQDRIYLQSSVEAEIFYGDQGDPEFLKQVIQKTKPLHIIIDDGSHESPDQRVSFEILFRELEKGGLYVVEDIHTAYRPSYGGGHKAPGSFVEYLKRMVDAMHANEIPEIEFPDFFKEISAVHFYPSLAIVEKKAKEWGGPDARGTHAAR